MSGVDFGSRRRGHSSAALARRLTVGTGRGNIFLNFSTPLHHKRKRVPVSLRQALRRWPDPVRNRSLVCDPGASPQIILPPPLTRRGWYNSAMRIAMTHKLSHRTTKGKKHLLAHVKHYDAGQIPFEIDRWFAIQLPAHRSFPHPPSHAGAGVTQQCESPQLTN